MSPKHAVEETTTAAVKRTFDLPRFEEFKAFMAERDSTPTLFFRRSMLDMLDGRHVAISYLRPENKVFLAEFAKELETNDMQFVFERVIEELRLVRRKAKK